MYKRFISLTLTLWIPALYSVALATPTPDIEETPKKILTLQALPKVHMPLIEDFDDQASYRQSITDRLKDLKNRANETRDEELRAKLLLAQANYILAYEVEPACTYKLLRLQDQPELNIQPQQLQAAFDRADRAIHQATAIINNLPEHEPDDDHKNQISMRKSLDILQAFAKAQRVYLLQDTENTQSEARRAASGLSAMVEMDHPKIASAATFWQSCIRNRKSDHKVVLSRLEYALAHVQQSTMPYSFFARLLRCRILADQGGYALSLSLLLQMEEHSREWFFNATQFDHIYRSIALTRIQTLRAWHEQLSEKNLIEERQWCLEQIQQLLESRFDSDKPIVVRLWPAIPIVTPIPE